MAPVLGQPPSMIVNTEKFPTDDILVREAIQYAVNQDEIIEVIYYGVYERAFGPLTQYNRYYDPAVEGMYSFDPDRAIELLEEAGWTLGSGDIREKDGQELNLVYLIFPGSEGLAELVQAQLREVGIGIEVLALNNPANLTAAQNGEHNVRWLNWLFSDAGELSTTFHSKNIGSGWNFARWRDAELDRLLDEGHAESDDAKRADIYSQIQHMVLEESLLIPMYIGAQVVTTRAEVKGLTIHKLGDTPLFYDVYLDE
jgi:peptide/nickel transport system substrate-binding protein